MKNRKILKLSIIIILLAINFTTIQSQTTTNNPGEEFQLNTITTAVPFLQIVPDARGGSMGDVGVATTPDVNAMHFNPSKYAFIDNNFGLSISYVPWLKKLVNDISISHIGGYYKIDKNNTVAASLRYFSLGSITFTNDEGISQGDYQPNEFSLDAAWARKLSDRFSLAISGRYIYSNLTLGQYVAGQESKAGNSVATDLSMFYTHPIQIEGVKKSNLAYGLNISNIGSKIAYTETTRKDFIPTNLRIGSAINMDIDDYNSFSFGVDFTKLLVPTPPIWGTIDTITGKQTILKGMDPNVTVISGMIHSFYDAPWGFKEELREINWAVGAEYWYNKRFAFRMGYFFEDKRKGERQFFTTGVGLKYSIFGIDVSYLVSTKNNNPLANTLRFSLTFDFDEFLKGSTIVE